MTTLPVARTTAQLESGLDVVRRAPRDVTRIDLIVRRPASGEREVLTRGDLHRVEGLVGDDWRQRGSQHTPDGSADPDKQITLMASRVAALVMGDRAHWPLAGDQLHADLDLSEDNLPPGTRLAVGDAVLEVSATPHTGCAKFATRFGRDAARFIATPRGRALRLRGLNARVINPGAVRVGDAVRKIVADGGF